MKCKQILPEKEIINLSLAVNAMGEFKLAAAAAVAITRWEISLCNLFYFIKSYVDCVDISSSQRTTIVSVSKARKTHRRRERGE
jgi:hypothetical protein